jgi:hypothetical protein
LVSRLILCCVRNSVYPFPLWSSLSFCFPSLFISFLFSSFLSNIPPNYMSFYHIISFVFWAVPISSAQRILCVAT